MVHKLESQFIGIGEVKGFVFTKEYESESAYVYRSESEGVICYEAFLKKRVPVCEDFALKKFSDTETKEIYPKSKDFGVWAWAFKDLDSAIKKVQK